MKYEILVSAQSVPQGPQPFALVITGSYKRDSTLFTEYAPVITPTNNTIVKGASYLSTMTSNLPSYMLTQAPLQAKLDRSSSLAGSLAQY